jgi:hypothetical protein
LICIPAFQYNPHFTWSSILTSTIFSKMAHLTK